MSERKNPQLGTLRRRSVSLLTAMSFLVLAVTGVLGFIRPFSIGIIGLHSLMGFLFIGLIALHVVNNSRPLTSYLRSKALWSTLAITAAKGAPSLPSPTTDTFMTSLSILLSDDLTPRAPNSPIWNQPLRRIAFETDTTG